MTESLEHIQHVENLVAYIRREFRHLFALVILRDTPSSLRDEKPPILDGFVPDVFAYDVPTTITIIGEAKTSTDLETDRSRAQIKTFIDFLRWRENSMFFLSIPFGLIAPARTVINAARRETSSELPQIVLLHGFKPYRFT